MFHAVQSTVYIGIVLQPIVQAAYVVSGKRLESIVSRHEILVVQGADCVRCLPWPRPVWLHWVHVWV